MAQAYSILTNEIGVAMVTAGPGVTNTVTGIANANLACTNFFNWRMYYNPPKSIWGLYKIYLMLKY